MPEDIFNVDPIKKYMAFWVGPNGAGKSIAIASWKEVGPVYFFDYDGRMASVANYYKQRGLKYGELQFDTYGPRNLYDAYEKLKGWVEAGRCPYALIAFDSFSAITVSAVTFSIRRRSGSRNPNELPKESKGGMMIPDWDEFNGEAMYVTMLLDLCKELASMGTAVIWTGHPLSRINIQGGQGQRQNISYQTKYAAFGTKSDALVPIYFNEIYHFGKEVDMDNKVHYICSTRETIDLAGISTKTSLNIPARFDWTGKDNFHSMFIQEVNKGLEYLKNTGGADEAPVGSESKASASGTKVVL